MKRIYLLLLSVILILVAANFYYYINIYKQQVDFQKNILMKQTEICSREIEQHISDFMDEIHFILSTEDISQFFINSDIKDNFSRRIEIFFSKYKELVTSISLYDDQKNVFNILRDQSSNPIPDIYISREQKVLYKLEKLEEHNGESVFTVPVFRDNVLHANFVIRIGTNYYIESVFSNYYIHNTLFSWLVNNNGEIIFNNFSSNILDFQGFDTNLHGQSDQNLSGSLVHTLDTDAGPLRVISSYYPIKFLHHDMLVVFSLNTSNVVSYIINSILAIAAVTFIVLIIIIGFFIYFIRNEQKEKHRSKKSEQTYKDIFESLPMGIIIKGMDGRIKMINNSALNILKIDDAKRVLEKDFSNMFFLYKDYSNNGQKNLKDRASEYVYYDSDESELILYKKEIPACFHEEKVFIEAFIDISPIEQARKNEFLFGEAKTEFLKRVSHDIRNSLNGIINLADSLELEISQGTLKTNKIQLIRNCCEEILLVMNDIMDFSSFDPVRILVEEIPFILPDEVDLVVTPMKHTAQEKNIIISTSINKNVPKNLIGDPFHIRQVLTNLLSNSLKYTHTGEIKLMIESNKQIDGNILLKFILEDSGIGISSDLLEILNNDGSSPELILPGSFGLKKTRQLIKLMNGEIFLESPISDQNVSGGPGTRVRFHIQLYSNDVSNKKLKFEHLKSYHDIRALVLKESGEENSGIQRVLRKLGISCETTSFNDSTVDLIKSNLSDPDLRYSIVFILNSEKSNGFSIAQALNESHIDENFLIIIISSVNRPGNFIKSRRFGADHYLMEPYEASEIFDIIQNNFSHIAIPITKNTPLKTIRPDLKILVAEDNPVNQIVSQTLFKSLGYTIDLVTNGREAMEKVRSKEYDIIFMDISMPEKNGLDATYEIRKLGYTMPIIAMTANAGETDKTEAMEVGMNGFISKPVRKDVLKSIIIKSISKDQN